jgi:hypothetical protein
MPWKECHAVDERLRFVARLMDGEKMAVLCESSGFLARRATRFTSAIRQWAYAAWWIAAGGRVDDIVTFEREPDNVHDANAILILEAMIAN